MSHLPRVVPRGSSVGPVVASAIGSAARGSLSLRPGRYVTNLGMEERDMAALGKARRLAQKLMEEAGEIALEAVRRRSRSVAPTGPASCSSPPRFSATILKADCTAG